MKRAIKIGGGVLAGLLLIAGAAFAYLYFRQPESAPPRQITVEKTPERIERGRYIFTSLADCDGCHSQHDYTKLGGPVAGAARGSGQQMPLQDLPGRIIASNITPDAETGIGSWTDGEKIRAIREGISRDGHMLFPIMPYPNFRYMSDYDVESLVAYLDTLPPVRNPLPKTQVDFPVSMFIKGVPRPVEGPVARVTPADGARYGEYLVTMASCEECHTPMVRGQSDSSMRFAGGRIFATPSATVVSANITPDVETGIGKWDFARFRDRVQSYRPYTSGEAPPVGPDHFTLMPWLAYSGLSDDDLAAIFTYIKARPPIAHRVETHPGFASAN